MLALRRPDAAASAGRRDALDRYRKPQALPHPELATLDHVVPLAERGDHSYANIRLAHYLCNAQSDRPPADVLRRLLEGVRTSWEENAAVADRLAVIGLVDRAGIRSRRIHLVTRTEVGWLLACAPQLPYAVECMQQTVSAPSCRPCRGIYDDARVG